MKIRYLDSMTPKDFRKHKKNGAIFAGLVDLVPDNYRHLIDTNESKPYCVITKETN